MIVLVHNDCIGTCSMCLHVCAYACVNVAICMYTRTHTRIHIHIYIHSHTHKHAHPCMSAHIVYIMTKAGDYVTTDSLCLCNIEHSHNELIL